MMVSPLLYGSPPRPLRVLVADDNADSTDTLAELLGLVGCDVAKAYDGSAVAPLAAAFRPDVCILDVRMPGVDGWVVARRLRDGVGGGRLLLIALTGVQGAAAADHSSAAGFDHHILKPSVHAEVMGDLNAFIERARVGPAVDTSAGGGVIAVAL